MAEALSFLRVSGCVTRTDLHGHGVGVLACLVDQVPAPPSQGPHLSQPDENWVEYHLIKTVIQ